MGRLINKERRKEKKIVLDLQKTVYLIVSIHAMSNDLPLTSVITGQPGLAIAMARTVNRAARSVSSQTVPVWILRPIDRACFRFHFPISVDGCGRAAGVYKLIPTCHHIFLSTFSLFMAK